MTINIKKLKSITKFGNVQAVIDFIVKISVGFEEEISMSLTSLRQKFLRQIIFFESCIFLKSYRKIIQELLILEIVADLIKILP